MVMIKVMRGVEEGGVVDREIRVTIIPDTALGQHYSPYCLVRLPTAV